MPHQTQRRHQDGVRRNGKYWSHQKGQRAHRLGEQCRQQLKKSSGCLRIWLDPKDLNRAIKRNHHVTPTLEELTHKFAGSTIFSKVDAQHGYRSVVLEEESSMLTTFNSPFGQYRYLRMPFYLVLQQVSKKAIILGVTSTRKRTNSDIYQNLADNVRNMNLDDAILAYLHKMCEGGQK